ncbi:MAG: YfaZ family outer membrane protein [Woeseiaceae bacterium]|nr:YfaZ family outer membrane protein [Woeseiaceae bacterium]
MKAYKALLGLALVFYAGIVSAQATARALDISLNDDMVDAGFTWRLGDNKLLADVGWLHNQDRGDVVGGGIHLVDAASAGDDPLQAGMGLRALYIDPDLSGDSGTAVALGGFVRYTLPGANRFNIGAHGYYAPDVVTFSDLSEFYEVGVRVGYNVLRDGDVFLGVRTVRAEFGDAGRLSLDSGLHIGFELRF